MGVRAALVDELESKERCSGQGIAKTGGYGANGRNGGGSRYERFSCCSYNACHILAFVAINRFADNPTTYRKGWYRYGKANDDCGNW